MAFDFVWQPLAHGGVGSAQVNRQDIIAGVMFAVNGGAFWVAKLMTDSSKEVHGDLKILHLAVGSIVFTVVMIIDIWLLLR